jgi:hypothetical protein
MTIDKAYRLTKGKHDKQAKARQETGKEEPASEYEGLPVSGEVNQPTGYHLERDNDHLVKLELWVHRENLNIPPGNDARLEAARAMLNSLRGFTVPDEFIRDIHTMLQALFQENLDAYARVESETPLDAAVLDILGTEHEE